MVGRLLAPGRLDRAQRLAARGGGDPSADGAGDPHAGDVLEQPQPRALHDVLGVVRRQPVCVGDRADAAGEALDERGPCRSIARRRRAHDVVEIGGVGGYAVARGARPLLGANRVYEG